MKVRNCVFKGRLYSENTSKHINFDKNREIYYNMTYNIFRKYKKNYPEYNIIFWVDLYILTYCPFFLFFNFFEI